jgi:hypothetical protein
MDIFLLNLGKWLAALGLPALLAFYVPQRWRAAALVLWLFLPVIVVLLLALEEIARDPSAFDRLGDGLQALLFVGAFAVIPWMGASAVGFAIGSAWRRSRSADERAAAAPPPPPGAPDQELHGAAGWRAQHVGFERDGLILEGLDVWALAWRKAAAAPISLPHPAHPSERHRFAVYEIGDGDGSVRFAAAELSNGVWGFYTPVLAEDPPGGLSADAALRFENRRRQTPPGDPAEVASTAFVWDVATGELLFDGSGWASSRVVPQSDGALLLALRHRDRDALFRLDPAARSFRVLGERGADPSLGRLAEVAERARRASEDRANAYLDVRLAPDGSTRVDLTAVEWSNSHWVNAPRVTEVATGRVLLDLWNTDWDAAVTFPRARCVGLDLRRYRGVRGVHADIDLARDRYAIQAPGLAAPVSGPLADVRAALDGLSCETPAKVERPLRGPVRARRRQAFVALLILVGALLVVAGASFVVQQINPAPPPKLTPIPEMPG